MEKFKKVLIASVMLSFTLIGVIIYQSQLKPPYQEVPLSPEDFQDYSSKLIAERSQGKWDDYNRVLASFKSDDLVFLGLRIWHLKYETRNGEEDLKVYHLEALALLNESRVKLEELRLLFNHNASISDVGYFGAYKGYNLDFTGYPHSSSYPTLVWKGVGYNKAGFRGEGFKFKSYNNSQDQELTITLTLVYSSGLFTTYESSTSLQIVIKD